MRFVFDTRDRNRVFFFDRRRPNNGAFGLGVWEKSRANDAGFAEAIAHAVDEPR